MANKDIQVRREDRTPSIANAFPDMNRMMERFFSDPFGSFLTDFQAMPRRAMADIRETDDAYVLCAEVPGVPKEDISISVNGNILTIRAEHKVEEGKEDSEEGYRREYRRFHQSFTLPSTVDADKVEANCENGMLEILLPKTERTQGRRVEVQSSKGGFWNRLSGKSGKTDNKQEPAKKH